MKIWKTREIMFIFKLHSAELHSLWRDILAWFSNWFRESILDLWDPAASKEIHFCNNSNLRKSCWRKVLLLLSNLRLSKRNNLHHNSRVNSKPRKGFLRGRWPSCTTISVLSMRTSFFRPPLSRDKLHESMYLWFFTIFRVFLSSRKAIWISISFPFVDHKKKEFFCTEVQFAGPSSRRGRLQCQHAIQVERDPDSGPTQPELQQTRHEPQFINFSHIDVNVKRACICKSFQCTSNSDSSASTPSAATYES